MRRIESLLNVRSEEFHQRSIHNRRLAANLKERQRKARDERPQRDIDRLRKQGKKLVRERYYIKEACWL